MAQYRRRLCTTSSLARGQSFLGTEFLAPDAQHSLWRATGMVMKSSHTCTGSCSCQQKKVEMVGTSSGMSSFEKEVCVPQGSVLKYRWFSRWCPCQHHWGPWRCQHWCCSRGWRRHSILQAHRHGTRVRSPWEWRMESVPFWSKLRVLPEQLSSGVKCVKEFVQHREGECNCGWCRFIKGTCQCCCHKGWTGSWEPHHWEVCGCGGSMCDCNCHFLGEGSQDKLTCNCIETGNSGECWGLCYSELINGAADKMWILWLWVGWMCPACLWHRRCDVHATVFICREEEEGPHLSTRVLHEAGSPH